MVVFLVILGPFRRFLAQCFVSLARILDPPSPVFCFLVEFFLVYALLFVFPGVIFSWLFWVLSEDFFCAFWFLGAYSSCFSLSLPHFSLLIPSWAFLAYALPSVVSRRDSFPGCYGTFRC